MSSNVCKGVILCGGGSKGTRMRPLTLDCPKPLLPIAGKPMVWHPLAALAQVPGLTEVLIIGFYEDAVMNPFIKEAKREFPNIGISYLREYKPLGTAGGLYHFRDSILRTPTPQNIFICNIDICSAWPLAEMMALHSKHRGVGTIMGVNVPRATATQYGCIVQDPETAGQVLHYVEKPESWISDMVNGGVYLFDKSVFDEIKKAMDSKADNYVQQDPFSQADDILRLEQDVIAPLAQAKKMYVYETADFWKQIKTAASAVSASKLYLTRFLKTRPDLLATPSDKNSKSGPTIIAPAYVDASARVSPSAKIGPNVAIGPGVYVGDGVRIKDAILLEGTSVERNAAILNSIVGRDCQVGPWARVDGEEESEAAAAAGAEGAEGRKISVTVLASDVSLAAETLVRSCIVLPNKSLSKSASNQVLL